MHIFYNLLLLFVFTNATISLKKDIIFHTLYSSVTTKTLRRKILQLKMTVLLMGI
jgi:hypothetical protein